MKTKKNNRTNSFINVIMKRLLFGMLGLSTVFVLLTSMDFPSNNVNSLTGTDNAAMISGNFQGNTKNWIAPATSNKLKNPYSGDPKAVSSGKAVYQKNCVICHGTKGAGDGIASASLSPKPANFLTARVTNETDGAIFWKIENGNTPMPAWKNTIPTNKIWDLVTYIRQLETKYGKKQNIATK